MESFQNLILEFGQQLHIDDVRVDDDGYLALTFDSQVVHLQFDEQTDELVIFTRLGEINPDYLSQVCLMLLSANLFWQGTQGATFSVESSTRLIFLAERQSLSLMSVSSLNNWLERFLHIAELWTHRITIVNAGERLELEPDEFL